MTSVYDTVADAIANVSGVDRAEIQPSKHIIDDLGVDSLDFLDITFDIDKALGIKLPIEDWMNENQSSGNNDALIMDNFVSFVQHSFDKKQ